MGGHQGTVTPVGHTLGTDAVCCGTQPHTTFCLEGIRQEGRGPGKARSRMAIPVLRGQVLVGWGRGLSSAQKLSRALLRLSCSCHLKSVPGLGTPSLSLTCMLTPKSLSPSLILGLSKARGLPGGGRDLTWSCPLFSLSCHEPRCGRFAQACTETSFQKISGKERGE